MHCVLLRQGKEWQIRLPGRTADALSRGERIEKARRAFRNIARLYGSDAIWLVEEGMVISSYKLEELAQHPYDRWRVQALKQVGLSYRGMYAAR